MSGGDVYLVTLPHPLFEPSELSFDQVNRDDVPTHIYQQLIEQGTSPWIWNPPEKLAAASSILKPNDILLFQYSGSYEYIASVAAITEDADLVEDICRHSDGSSLAIFLTNVETFHVSQDRLHEALAFDEVIRIGQDASLVRVADGAWERHGSAFRWVTQLIGFFERRNVYDLVDSLTEGQPTKSPWISQRRPIFMSNDTNPEASVSEIIESMTDRFFESFWGLYKVKRLAIPFVLAGIGTAFLFESVMCASTVLPGMTGVLGQCLHVWTPEFIESATTLSFSLTAFLLVGVTVLVGVESQQGSNELNDNGQGRTAILDVRPGTREEFTDNDPHFDVSDIVEYQDGRRIGGAVGPRWYIEDVDERRVTVVEVSERSDAILLGSGVYRIRKPDEGEPDGNIWRVYGSYQGSPQYKIELNWLLEDNRRVDWIVGEVDQNDADEGDVSRSDPREQFRAKLGKALSYSISASILGIVIQGYPWSTTANMTPWLSDLSPVEHIGYWASSYVFIVIFLGMVWTSVGLIELMLRLSQEPN